MTMGRLFYSEKKIALKRIESLIAICQQQGHVEFRDLEEVFGINMTEILKPPRHFVKPGWRIVSTDWICETKRPEIEGFWKIVFPDMVDLKSVWAIPTKTYVFRTWREVKLCQSQIKYAIIEKGWAPIEIFYKYFKTAIFNEAHKRYGWTSEPEWVFRKTQAVFDPNDQTELLGWSMDLPVAYEIIPKGVKLMPWKIVNYPNPEVGESIFKFIMEGFKRKPSLTVADLETICSEEFPEYLVGIESYKKTDWGYNKSTCVEGIKLRDDGSGGKYIDFYIPTVLNLEEPRSNRDFIPLEEVLKHIPKVTPADKVEMELEDITWKKKIKSNLVPQIIVDLLMMVDNDGKKLSDICQKWMDDHEDPT